MQPCTVPCCQQKEPTTVLFEHAQVISIKHGLAGGSRIPMPATLGQKCDPMSQRQLRCPSFPIQGAQFQPTLNNTFTFINLACKLRIFQRFLTCLSFVCAALSVVRHSSSRGAFRYYHNTKHPIIKLLAVSLYILIVLQFFIWFAGFLSR